MWPYVIQKTGSTISRKLGGTKLYGSWSLIYILVNIRNHQSGRKTELYFRYSKALFFYILSHRCQQYEHCERLTETSKLPQVYRSGFYRFPAIRWIFNLLLNFAWTVSDISRRNLFGKQTQKRKQQNRVSQI